MLWSSLRFKSKHKYNNNNINNDDDDNNNNLYYAFVDVHSKLILQSSRFTYNRKLINNDRINVQARKLNEPVGFLVTCSSLNNLGSR